VEEEEGREEVQEEDGLSVGQLMSQFAPGRARKPPGRPRRQAVNPGRGRGAQRQNSTGGRGRRIAPSLAPTGSAFSTRGQWWPGAAKAAPWEAPEAPQGAPREALHRGEVQGEGLPQRRPRAGRGRRGGATRAARSAAQAPTGRGSGQPDEAVPHQPAQRPLLPLLPYPAASPVERGHPSAYPRPGVPPLLPAVAHPGYPPAPQPAPAAAIIRSVPWHHYHWPLPHQALIPMCPCQAPSSQPRAWQLVSSPSPAAAAAQLLQPLGQRAPQPPWAPSPFAMMQVLRPVSSPVSPAQREELISQFRGHTQLLFQVRRWLLAPCALAPGSSHPGMQALSALLSAFLLKRLHRCTVWSWVRLESQKGKLLCVVASAWVGCCCRWRLWRTPTWRSTGKPRRSQRGSSHTSCRGGSSSGQHPLCTALLRRPRGGHWRRAPRGALLPRPRSRPGRSAAVPGVTGCTKGL